jgi:hypothetical protein
MISFKVTTDKGVIVITASSSYAAEDIAQGTGFTVYKVELL